MRTRVSSGRDSTMLSKRCGAGRVKRLEEGRVENEELRRRLEREMAGSGRGGSVVDGHEERWDGNGDKGEDGARWEQGVEERDVEGEYEIYVGRGGRSMSRGRNLSVDWRM
ncbi:unnamed protein product [Zymoseptoria tritici ST99CH_3D1]|nr:unnamed protein product [Zymoseptoria tritici ST99CH_3D1]